MAAMGGGTVEYKLDCARIPGDKVGDEVKVYSRNLRDVTLAVPEVVAVARAMPARELVLDGEVIALRENGTPEAFQIAMKRFGRKLDVDRLRAELPVTPFFFDALYVDGMVLVDDPLTSRVQVLGDQVSAGNLVPRFVTADVGAAAGFAARALAAGHEGGMAKAVDGVWAAGRRGRAWFEVRQARTPGLVVPAAD